MVKMALPILVPLLAVGLVLGGLATAGHATRQWLRDQDRVALALEEIQCPTPPGVDREVFLLQIQALGDLPDRLRLLDDNLPARLADAFRRHPWVEKVERVAVLPPRQVQVSLAFRRPALVVTQQGAVRVVDAMGVLLPPLTAAHSLPAYRGTLSAVAVVSGVKWPDGNLETAARTAGYLQPYEGELRFTTFEVVSTGSLVCYTAGGTRMIWGHAPGAEIAGELSAVQKLERLRQFCRQHGNLDQGAPATGHDVRR